MVDAQLIHDATQELRRDDGLKTFDVSVDPSMPGTSVRNDDIFLVSAKTHREAIDAFCRVRHPNGARSLAGYLRSVGGDNSDFRQSHDGYQAWCAAIISKDKGDKLPFGPGVVPYKVASGKVAPDGAYAARFGTRRRRR